MTTIDAPRARPTAELPAISPARPSSSGLRVMVGQRSTSAATEERRPIATGLSEPQLFYAYRNTRRGRRAAEETA